MSECKDCKHSILRCEHSYNWYGNYHCSYECTLKENERTPFRRLDDSCKRWEQKS